MMKFCLRNLQGETPLECLSVYGKIEKCILKRWSGRNLTRLISLRTRTSEHGNGLLDSIKHQKLD
jgi:hypothetical protein